MTECPFVIGQLVVFKPDNRVLGLQVMVENLMVGRRYKIEDVRDKTYVTLEGVSSAGGGLHWSAFVAG